MAQRVDPAARRRLLAWYRANRRDMPWRRTSDPYAIWVSEAMLQQTRVATAVPYFERWMQRFPTVASLASASEADVLAAWSGLGYYSRARNLHQAAKVVMQRHGGLLPRTAEALRQLPGIGAYTAGAVASIAFGQRVAAVDGNVVRVVCRVGNVQGDPTRPAVRRGIEQEAAAWVPPTKPGDWNQAMMELGATVCTPRAPDCAHCPVAAACAAFKAGTVHRIPPPRVRAKPETERRSHAIIVHKDRLLVVRNPPGLLAGMWALPGGAGSEPLADLVRRQTGITVRIGPVAAAVRHAFTHRTWAMQVHHGALAEPAVGQKRLQNGGAAAEAGATGRQTGPESAWLPLDSLADEAIPTAYRKALAAAGLTGGDGGAQGYEQERLRVAPMRGR